MLRFLKQKQTKYTIFLDCDGVINAAVYSTPSFYVDKKCVHILGEIVKAANATVVLCSTWRKGFDKNGKHEAYIQNLIDICKENNIDIVDITPVSRHEENRQAEIEYYCKKYNITDYIVLDDDTTLYNGTRYLYQTDSKTGLVESDISKIKKHIRKGDFCHVSNKI